MVGKFFVLLLAALFYGCATVPKDAPQVFHETRDVLDTLDEKDVDEYMPKTVERANNTCDTALDTWKESREENSVASEEVAVEQARDAKQTAEGALLVYNELMAWDNSPTSFQEALALLEGREQFVSSVAIVEPISPYAKLKGTEVTSAVAYFDTNDANSPDISEDDLSALTEILKKDQNFNVVLTGFADQRANADYNRDLAMRRARTIAGELRDRGVAEEQITIESVGESKAQAGEGEIVKMQLDRKVQATLAIN